MIIKNEILLEKLCYNYLASLNNVFDLNRLEQLEDHILSILKN